MKQFESAISKGMDISNDSREKYAYNLASNLRLLRAKLAISQGTLANAAGVSRQTIVQAENAGKLSWTTYLALVFLFSKNQDTAKLMRVFDAYPIELKRTNDFFSGGKTNDQ